MVRRGPHKSRRQRCIKIEPATEFGETKRWDVPRFWGDDELVTLGVRDQSVERIEFVEEITDTLRELLIELQDAQSDIVALTPNQTAELSIGDPNLFILRPGRRIRHQDVLAHPGDLPVYSCFTRSTAEKGRVSEEWATSIGVWVIEEPTVTVNATGASGVGIVFVRENRCTITDDVIAVIPKPGSTDLLGVSGWVTLKAAGMGGGCVEGVRWRSGA